MDVEAVVAVSAAVVLDGVSVRYGSAAPVVSEVTLTASAGSWLTIIGPNGAGKSSVLKAIAGLVVSTGAITIDGEAVADVAAPTVAYVPQDPIRPAGMTVAEYALLGRSAHLGWLSVEGRHDRAVVDDVLARLALDDLAGRPVTELSGGEAQRATLARALAQEAPVLLLDEPTSALDIGHTVSVLELVDELRAERGLTVLAAMHDLGTAGRFAETLAMLDGGEVVAIGPPAEVLTESILSRHYDAEVEILTGADGAPVVVPLRAGARSR